MDTSPSCSMFMDLPAEVRLIIYQELFSDRRERRLRHPLLNVSELVRKESAAILIPLVSLNIDGNLCENSKYWEVYCPTGPREELPLRLIDFKYFVSAQYLADIKEVYFVGRTGTSLMLEIDVGFKPTPSMEAVFRISRKFGSNEAKKKLRAKIQPGQAE